MESTPKISICIPVFNGEHFLSQAVESALRQNHSDFEVIIVDNASTDGTADLATKMAVGNSKIRLIQNHSNIGLVANFNTCLRLAKGEYIKFLCVDDLLMPDCLIRMSAVLDAYPAVTLVAAGRQIMNQEGTVIGIQHYARTGCRVAGFEVINRCFFGANFIGEPSAVMFRRTSALRGFSEELAHLMDLEMWFHLLEQGELANLPEPLCAIRRHEGQMTLQSIKSGMLIEDNVRLFEEYGKKPYIQNTWLNALSHSARIAYRVWISRKYLEPKRREEIVRAYSSPLLYYVMMPILSGLLTGLNSVRRIF